MAGLRVVLYWAGLKNSVSVGTEKLHVVRCSGPRLAEQARPWSPRAGKCFIFPQGSAMRVIFLIVSGVRGYFGKKCAGRGGQGDLGTFWPKLRPRSA